MMQFLIPLLIKFLVSWLMPKAEQELKGRYADMFHAFITGIKNSPTQEDDLPKHEAHIGNTFPGNPGNPPGLV